MHHTNNIVYRESPDCYSKWFFLLLPVLRHHHTMRTVKLIIYIFFFASYFVGSLLAFFDTFAFSESYSWVYRVRHRTCVQLLKKKKALRCFFGRSCFVLHEALHSQERLHRQQHTTQQPRKWKARATTASSWQKTLLTTKREWRMF